MRLLCVSILFCLFYGCIPPSGDGDDDAIQIDLSNEKYQKILNLKDERRGDLLLPYLKSPFATERYLAVEAFSSFKSADAIQPLLEIVNTDPLEELRIQAAYALGQIGDPVAELPLVQAFSNQDTAVLNNEVRMTILEAIGKLGSKESLDQIATVSTYSSSDNFLLLGQARAIYRFGLRGILSPLATDRMVDIVLDKTIDKGVRVMAANYLARMKKIDLTEHSLTLANSMGTFTDPDIRMTVALAVGRDSSAAMTSALLSQLSTDTDYRVKVNIIRALDSHPYIAYRDSILALVNDENEHVALTAAGLIEDHTEGRDGAILFNLVNTPLIDPVKAKIYGGILKAVPYYFANTRKRATDETLQTMDAASSVYIKANFLKALSYDPINYSLLESKGLKSKDNVLVTGAITVLPNILNSPKFLQVFRTSAAQEKVKDDIRGYFIDIFNSDNAGAMAAAASILRSEILEYKDDIVLKSAMRDALLKRKLPEELEAKIEMDQTIAFMEDKDYIQEPLNYDHPIDWTVLKDISDSSRVYIITTKGQIELEIYKSHAPGSVANFVNLIKSDFYDNKFFHRVVPNFVVQAGCPRGDGYGSLDYTIRSELGPKYYDAEGYIGMASAGPDTEGTQWFITHSPTPHLDGRYTIFGKVLTGMDVVHQLQVGDAIVDMRILKVNI
jgi:cyclophilin family peptidyl-prolyl cis-trans isomerase/HEAT repeat protein